MREVRECQGEIRTKGCIIVKGLETKSDYYQCLSPKEFLKVECVWVEGGRTRYGFEKKKKKEMTINNKIK